MKKIIICLFLLCSFSVYGEEVSSGIEKYRAFTAGITAGLSMNQIDGDNYGGYNKPGLIAGVVVNREIASKFTLSMELKFIQKGSRASYNIKTQSGRFYRVNLNYTQLPVYVQYNVWKDLWIELGPEFAYLINYKEEDDRGDLETIPFRKIEFAAFLGVAYNIPKTNLKVNLRAANSIIPVRVNKNQTYYPDWKSRGQFNRNLEFGLTYIFK
jgi:hypothetical protein